MTQLTQLRLTAMLQLQNQLNAKVNPNWRLAGYAWHRAIMVEGTELLEHIGWKWWKKQEPNIAQAKIELVDIWHFAMSLALVNDNAEELLRSSDLSMSMFTTTQKIDTLIGAASAGRFHMPAFRGLMNDLDMTWGELYDTYVAKNVLNMFRQDNGYKQGTYKKFWGGVEDNVVLERLMAKYPEATPDDLIRALAVEYKALTQE